MTERQWDSSSLESCCQKWNGALYYMCQLSDRIPYDAHFALLAGWRIRIRPVRISREPRANRNLINRDWIISLSLLHCISLLRWRPEFFFSNINTNLRNWVSERDFSKDIPKQNHSERPQHEPFLANVLNKQQLLTLRFVLNWEKVSLELPTDRHLSR